MSGSNSTGAVLGASTTAAATGIAVLPNTGGNILLTVYSIVTIALGIFVLGSFAASRLANKIAR